MDGYRDHLTADDWSDFDHVYEVHNPQLILSNSTRNVRGRNVYAAHTTDFNS